jgi:hypothetical protein
MHSIWEIASTFAGPAATVIAAFAAVCVTVYFNRRHVAIAAGQAAIAVAQKDIASAQRGIAYDKLK